MTEQTEQQSITASVTVRAPAKINPHLGVGPVRSDGFHPLTTVYQAIGLYDDLTATHDDRWSVEVEPVGRIDVADVPRDATNLAVRAGQLLLDHHEVEGAARLHIRKGIPVAGGLAGGSADAAAALVAVDRLFGLGTDDETLLALAATLGSDIPFALVGGTALGTGRGELVEPVEDRGAWWWVVLPSDRGLSTPEVYRRFDEEPPGSTGHPETLLEALAAGDPDALGRALRNDLQESAFGLRPDLLPTMELLASSSALGALLSGSGPTCLALARDGEHARRLAAELAEARSAEPVLYAPAAVAGAHVLEGER